jgi:hypothetical protein
VAVAWPWGEVIVVARKKGGFGVGARQQGSGETALTVIVYNVLSFVQTDRMSKLKKLATFMLVSLLGLGWCVLREGPMDAAVGCLRVHGARWLSNGTFHQQEFGVSIGLKGRPRAKHVASIRTAPYECAGRDCWSGAIMDRQMSRQLPCMCSRAADLVAGAKQCWERGVVRLIEWGAKEVAPLPARTLICLGMDLNSVFNQYATLFAVEVFLERVGVLRMAIVDTWTRCVLTAGRRILGQMDNWAILITWQYQQAQLSLVKECRAFKRCVEEASLDTLQELKGSRSSQCVF